MRVWWRLGMWACLAILLSGCEFVAPVAPSATWEPLPSLALGTASPSPSVTPQETEAPTATLATPRATPSPTPLPTATGTPTATHTPEPSATELVPTDTATPQPTASSTPMPTTAMSRPLVQATRVPPSELVEGWVGTIQALPTGSTYDDYFAAEATGGQYGIDALVDAIRQQVATQRAAGARVRVWGVLDYGVADYGNMRITVTRIEPVG